MRQDFKDRMKETMVKSQIPPEPEPAEGDSTVPSETSTLGSQIPSPASY